MDFSRPHILEESVATKSMIRYIKIPDNGKSGNTGDAGKDDAKKVLSLDDQLLEAANEAAAELLKLPITQESSSQQERMIDSALFPERMTPQTETIEANQLVVIFESFDNLNFVYATPKAIFSNRNGHFHHDDFIGKPYGCKIRSRNNRGYGFCYLLKATPELWARSLNHRTQIVHELDASMVVFYLDLRPNMVVCESGTGSGAMSHAILRTIAPKGLLHTFEFNKMRAETARAEFQQNGLTETLVQVHHKDVCGKTAGDDGGFDLPGQSVSAVFLDLPEPWLAIPHAAYVLKPNCRIASYSPCVEQTQKTVAAMKRHGFHSLKTMEFRMRENYVDEVDYEMPPTEKRPKFEKRTDIPPNATGTTLTKHPVNNDKTVETDNLQSSQAAMTTTPAKRKKTVLVARPFVTMRGHTAFLTFATSSTLPQPNPNDQR